MPMTGFTARRSIVQAVHAKISASIAAPPRPTRPPRFPQKPRGKEVKIKMGAVAAIVTGVFGAMTEIKDFLESLYDALPDDVKRRYKGRATTTLARAVWENFDQIDWGKATWNLVKNEIEDRIIGLLQSGRARLGDVMADMGFAPGLNPGYFAGSGSFYSGDDEYAFEQAVRKALRDTGARVSHRGSSIVGDYR